MVDLPITKWIKKKIRRLIAIVEDTDVATHSIASGKYVVWKGDLHKSTAPIAVGGSLSLSNLSPVSDGGLNELSEQIVTRKLLWSNNSPSSDFGADTRYLSESASNFDEIQIYFQEKTGKNVHVQTFSNSFTESAIFCINGGNTGNHSYDLMTFSRRVDISGTSFYCGDCIYNHGGGSVGFAVVTRNDLVIPIYVYGLKYGK